MDMEKYNNSVDKFAELNCNVKEVDIVRKVKSTNKNRLKALAGLAACIAVIFIGTTVSAATGLLDISGLFRKLFNDEVTQNLIDEGALQEIKVTAETDNYTITFEGLTGDSETQYGIFKLVDNKGTLGNPSMIKLDAKMGSISEVREGRLPDYSFCINEGFTASDDEENTYYIKLFLRASGMYDSQEDIYVSLEKIIAYYGDIECAPETTVVIKADRTEEIPFNQNLIFTPDRSILQASTVVDMDSTINTEYGEVTFARLDYTKYYTELVITFPTNDSLSDVFDATDFWHKLDNDYYYEALPDGESDYSAVEDEFKIGYSTYNNGDFTVKRAVKTVKDPTIYTEGEFKLFVDGIEVKRLVNTGYRWASAMDSEENPTYWGNIIRFKPVNADAAETIEIRYKDQAVKVR